MRPAGARARRRPDHRCRPVRHRRGLPAVTAHHPGSVVAVLEGRDASGGTWDLFRYPGIRSDSDMFTFGYRWRPWPGDTALADGAADPGLRRARSPRSTASTS